MFENKMKGRVRPIRFQSIDEDEQNQSAHQWRRSKRSSKLARGASSMEEANQDYASQQFAEAPRPGSGSRRLQRPNFSLEYSYPAVILENVCFSVDRSQQQSNFLNECLFRLNKCLSFSGADTEKREQLDRVQILKSVNLSVPYGSIFGLLGPSSCGKTTLLRCLVGLLEPSSGSIRLFGRNAIADSADVNGVGCCSGSRSRATRRSDCKVPGSNVGYMPQDLGLYEDFTIAQLLTMFGRYMRMDAQLIEARIEFMARFLELPHVGRQIQTLSGGQKRRVSFAIACLHMPPLIILDEPTVGVDPLLRQSIWRYLRCLASEENKTIVITTHYIEEAAQADQVALMRAGEVLVQDSPSKIMQLNDSQTLEEAFLKICNNVQSKRAPTTRATEQKVKLLPQPQFSWQDELDNMPDGPTKQLERALNHEAEGGEDSVMKELKLRAQEKLAIYDKLRCCRQQQQIQHTEMNAADDQSQLPPSPNALRGDVLSMTPDAQRLMITRQPRMMSQILEDSKLEGRHLTSYKSKKNSLLKRNKLILNQARSLSSPALSAYDKAGADIDCDYISSFNQNKSKSARNQTADSDSGRQWLAKSLVIFWALLYKNYRRNVNSIPLLAFQFMLPMIQMISFSLCVGGRPTSVGLGIVNQDQPISFSASDLIGAPQVLNGTDLLAVNSSLNATDDFRLDEESLSLRYLSFIDKSMLTLKPYDNLREALVDVRRAKLWAVLEIGENFTASIAKRFDLDNFYQLDLPTIHQSVIRLYPDRSNKILDMICHRSLVDSYRKFLSDEFEHFKQLPIEIARPIFDIKPNVISNSIDGYTESIAPGLLASLTYIMAAGLTTFIMVVERSAGILERTYTSGINPVSYLLAHAIFRSLVMMIQIALVLILTFYVLRQPLVGSIWLAYSMLMILNVTGISYGLLISSIVTDQNGAALTIVSSLVVKITLSGILWPFEAIPMWLRTICYIQPLTMPVQALKAITLKGATLGDRAVNLGFLVSISWLLVFLTVSAKRFKFYQH